MLLTSVLESTNECSDINPEYPRVSFIVILSLELDFSTGGFALFVYSGNKTLDTNIMSLLVLEYLHTWRSNISGFSIGSRFYSIVPQTNDVKNAEAKIRSAELICDAACQAKTNTARKQTNDELTLSYI